MTHTVSDDTETMRRVLNFPKPPLRGLVTGTTKQAKWIWGLMLLCAAILGGISLVNDFVALMLLLIVMPGLTLVALILQTGAFFQRRQIRKLIAGQYYVNWPIAAEPWQAVLDRRKQIHSSIPILLAKWFGTATLVMVTLYYFIEGTLLFGSHVLHFLLPTAVVTLGSYLAGQVVVFFTEMTDRIMRTNSPQLVIGPCGIYMTGLFWPKVAPSQRLVSSKVDEANCELECQYRIVQRHGVELRDFNYPFPPDQIDVAHLVARLLNDPPEEA